MAACDNWKRLEKDRENLQELRRTILAGAKKGRNKYEKIKALLEKIEKTLKILIAHKKAIAHAYRKL